MKKVDMRSLHPQARLERRRQVVMLREKGWTLQEIAAHVGLSVTGTSDIWQRYVREGEQGLEDKPCGRRYGEDRALSVEQEREIRWLMVDKTPDELDMEFALWNRVAVMRLIEQRYGVKLTPQGVGLYLRRWGFTPQKPLQRAYEQDPKAVQKWLEEDYPAIEAKAQEQKGEIHWADETGLRSDDVRGRSYAPAGQTPEIRVNQRRDSISILSSVTNRGKLRFMGLEGALNADRFIEFLRRLVREVRQKTSPKVFLIVDNLRVHHAKKVQAWVQQHHDCIELFYLPSYSPQLNPDEMLNASLKAAVTTQAPARKKGQLKQAAYNHLRHLQKSPKKVQQFFEHSPIKYAAHKSSS
jgi:transposase